MRYFSTIISSQLPVETRWQEASPERSFPVFLVCVTTPHHPYGCSDSSSSPADWRGENRWNSSPADDGWDVWESWRLVRAEKNISFMEGSRKVATSSQLVGCRMSVSVYSIVVCLLTPWQWYWQMSCVIVLYRFQTGSSYSTRVLGWHRFGFYIVARRGDAELCFSPLVMEKRIFERGIMFAVENSDAGSGTDGWKESLHTVNELPIVIFKVNIRRKKLILSMEFEAQYSSILDMNYALM